ncbi:hypothetical protein IJ579_05140 [bacterium]|nr:hypothetical protein [bacterium]
MKISPVSSNFRSMRLNFTSSSKPKEAADFVNIPNNVDDNFTLNDDFELDGKGGINISGTSFGEDFKLNFKSNKGYRHISGNIGDKDVLIEMMPYGFLDRRNKVSGHVGNKNVDINIELPWLRLGYRLKGKFGDEDIKIATSHLSRGGILVGGDGVDMVLMYVMKDKTFFSTNLKHKLVGKYYIDKDFLPILLSIANSY